MNYILSLKLEIAALEAQRDALAQGLDDLRTYVFSPKFLAPGDLSGYVNVQDIDLRVQETLSAGVVAHGTGKAAAYAKAMAEQMRKFAPAAEGF